MPFGDSALPKSWLRRLPEILIQARSGLTSMNLQRTLRQYRQNDGVAYYWIVIMLLGAVLSLLLLPFDFHLLNAPARIPVLVRGFCAFVFALGALLPYIFRQNFSSRVFPSALLVACIVLAASLGYLERYAPRTMYYNGLFQGFLACAFMRITLPFAVGVYCAPVLVYRAIAGAEHFAEAQPEILLLTVIGFAANRGVRTAAQRIEQAGHAALMQWTRASAHELKAPLLAIRMIAHEFPEDPVLDKRTANAMQEIRRLCNRGLAVQNRILLNARYQDPVSAQKTRIYAGESIRRALHEYELLSAEQASLFHIDIDPDFEFDGDSLLFENVIHNLTANAMRAIHAKGSGSVRITVDIDGDMGRIVYYDTGHGIAPELLDSIFVPGTTYSGGTGFGLAFCRAVIESFGGSLRCESQDGEYTRFIIRLPLN